MFVQVADSSLGNPCHEELLDALQPGYWYLTLLPYSASDGVITIVDCCLDCNCVDYHCLIL